MSLFSQCGHNKERESVLPVLEMGFLYSELLQSSVPKHHDA